MRLSRRTARARLLASAAIGLFICSSDLAFAADRETITIAPQALESALYDFGGKTGLQVLFAPGLTTAKRTDGVSGEADVQLAMAQLLQGTGLTYRRDGDMFVIVRADDPQSGSAAGDGADGTVEALIVTAQKREEDIQDVPIAISAFTQETLERSQVAGGPDLMTQVPNMTFTKTNFSSYSIQIRGIGTQAVSATTDAAVAVAFNNASMIRNRFFEQEFYDLARIEVLRGPQGTLYGRNATAGVVNIISTKPTFTPEAKLSADVANYGSTRLEGMINIPLIEDAAALRIAGAWTKRDGYVTNELSGDQIDGRDLWSTRVSLRVEPTDRFALNLVWEHFEEDDDRLRSGKQLCKKHTPTTIGGIPVQQDNGFAGFEGPTFSQGCLPSSLYSPDSFQTPNGFALPYYAPLGQLGLPIFNQLDPYVSDVQSRDLRTIESTLTPQYEAESNVFQFLLSYELTSSLSLAWEAAYSSDELFSFQDFNRFNTRTGVFDAQFAADQFPAAALLSPDGTFCDPQLGCANRLVLGDLSTAKSHQFSQEVRLSSDFDGAFNFSLGVNFVRYDTEDKYYVFINSLSMWSALRGYLAMPAEYVAGVTTNAHCLENRLEGSPNIPHGIMQCIPMDTNSIHSLDDSGHNYFLSKNPYKLISYAMFGEAYYQIAPTVKVTAGLRWTSDRKEAPVIPSWLIVDSPRFAPNYGYPVIDVVTEEWREPTGRLAVDWKPALSFTDETMVYGSYARGYKAGGMNPPPAVIGLYTSEFFDGLMESVTQPRTFDAEFVDAFELGAKNTLAGGAVTLNLAAFYYDYKNYQLSQIINRSAVTQNFDAEIWGLEIEADWRPLENLRLGFKGGYQNTQVGDGEQAIDIMDRTAGHADWVVTRPFPTIPSNCILPLWLVTYGGQINTPSARGGQAGPCAHAYLMGLDPVTVQPYVPDPDVTGIGDNGGLPTDHWQGYPGFNPETAPNNGEGFFKDLGGNELPNAPNFTATLTADYTLPLPNDWLATLHTDLYYQSEAWTRIFNMEGYDKLKAYTNVNLAAIFTNEDAGWKVMAYVKNVFDRDSITGAFLNSDDTGLTTNVFLTEPRLYGLRVTKEWTGGSLLGGLVQPGRSTPAPFTVELGGQVARAEASAHSLEPMGVPLFSTVIYRPGSTQDDDLDWGDERSLSLTYRLGDNWKLRAGARWFGTNAKQEVAGREDTPSVCGFGPPYEAFCDEVFGSRSDFNWARTSADRREEFEMAQFDVGRNVGFGQLISTVSAGVRYAKFQSDVDVFFDGVPDTYIAPEFFTNKYAEGSFNRQISDLEARRTFEGAGPELSWDASLPLAGSDEVGRLSAEVSLTGGVLFGKQETSVIGAEEVQHYVLVGIENFRALQWPIDSVTPGLVDVRRSKSVSVPLGSVSLGLSYELDRLKLGAGYRWERYFDAIDDGYRTREEDDRTVDGPYFKISLGFGG